ncbi:ATP-binding protein, partial [Corynebacterium lehmanniae]
MHKRQHDQPVIGDHTKLLPWLRGPRVHTAQAVNHRLPTQLPPVPNTRTPSTRYPPNRYQKPEPVNTPGRTINKEQITRLAHCQWCQSAQNIVILGKSSVGKTYLAQA